MLAHLKQALLTNNIHLKYQPIYASTSNRVTGFETLLRWRHPHFGRICPEKLVRLASANGLMSTLSALVIEKALAEMAEFVNQYSLLLSINISPADLICDVVTTSLFNGIAKHQISPERVMLEITEVPCKHLHKINKNATALSEAGFSLALDDFGKGCSDMDRLLSLPISVVKIDRGLTHALLEPGARCDSIRRCCEDLYQQPYRLIFEGVETASHSLFLHAHFPQAFQQGWYFSKAMPIDEVRALLEGSVN